MDGFILPYLGIGIFISIVTDISIREMQSSEPFTLFEFLLCILLWPMVVVQIIVEFFNKD